GVTLIQAPEAFVPMHSCSPRDLSRPAIIVVGCLSACIPAFGQAVVEPSSGGTLSDIRVDASGERETATSPGRGSRATTAATATRAATPLAGTPQAVTVITRDQMVDQGATSLQDALNCAAGVRSDAYGLDSRTDSARVRGS